MTPPEIFHPLNQVFGFGLDAAAQSHTRKVANYLGPDHEDPTRRDALDADGLGATWAEIAGGRPTWLNPEYSDMPRWMAEVVWQANHGTVVVLPWAHTDLHWWWTYVLGRVDGRRDRRLRCASAIIWLQGRVAFLDPYTLQPRDSAPKGSAVLVYHPDEVVRDWPENVAFSELAAGDWHAIQTARGGTV